jgi:hypothetical protein
MKILNLLDTIRNNNDYVINSLYLKSYNNCGCVYKWLVRAENIAYRKEIFIAYAIDELSLEEKEILDYIEIIPVH